MADILYDAEWIKSSIDNLSEKLAEFAGDNRGLAIVGIRTRGAYIAKRLCDKLLEKGLAAECGELDITLYRDDIAEGGGRKPIQASNINFDLNGRDVVLVDDVIYTGRTIRAALDELVDFGRPSCIKLLCLLDRGGRELPIQPDFLGGVVEMTGKSNRVGLKMTEIDGIDEVVKEITD
ncbi:MAG: bifunctional pyr operon transcriptional regulator/uracil phosphoribosyltransferase PyrR [Planctomycetota bacterium]|jgi:pyrimidine operon attenuation protein/uracil phosphoribosyltransferase